jgi:hypothetical protein
MQRQRIKRSNALRRFLGWLTVLTPGIVGCSFFAPSLGEYAQTRPGTGGVAGIDDGNAGSAGSNVAASTGNSDGGSLSAGGNGNAGAGGVAVSAEGGAEAGATGEAGWAGAVSVGKPVTQSDLALLPVIIRGMPTFVAFTSYGSTEATAAQTTPPRDAPLYQPDDSTAAAWWDNLVAEELHARIAVALFPTHGAYSLTTTDTTGPDLMNPRRLSNWLSALDRAAASNLVQAACFVDMPSVQAVSNKVHAKPASTLMDLSVQADWDQVIWQRSLKPWFDTIPSSYWFTLKFNPDSGSSNALVEFGSLSTSSFSNAAGNLSSLLTFLETSFFTAYNANVDFVLDSTWFAIEPGLTNNANVVAKNDLIAKAPNSAAFTSYQGATVGAAVPGLIDPSYFQSTSPNYQSASVEIARHTVDSYGTPVTTLQTGLAGAIQKQATMTVLQDAVSLDQWTGFYRSAAADWHTPNEYLNLIRRYSDPATLTERLEAEGCDKYSDTTSGNSGGAFRRGGDLDVRSLTTSGGWAVTNTAAGEWIEFDDVDFSSGTYDFSIKYATSASSSIPKRVQLIIDDTRLTPIIATDTGNADTFATSLLAESFMAHGTHNLRVRFIDGFVDLDWIFIRKIDPPVFLQVAGGTFVTALEGGGSTFSTATKAAGIFERYRFDDLNGGSLADGDSVQIQCDDGLYASLVAGAVTAAARTPGTPETFTIHSVSGGDITAGSKIALAASDGKHYLTVSASNTLDGTGTSVGSAQTFTLGYY